MKRTNTILLEIDNTTLIWWQSFQILIGNGFQEIQIIKAKTNLWICAINAVDNPRNANSTPHHDSRLYYAWTLSWCYWPSSSRWRKLYIMAWLLNYSMDSSMKIVLRWKLVTKEIGYNLRAVRKFKLSYLRLKMLTEYWPSYYLSPS